jgi:hypothetical protein
MKRSQATTAFAWSIAAAAGLTALIWLLNPLLAGVAHLPDKGAAWYFWQSVPETRTFLTHVSPWIGYVLHQASLWVIVVLMMKERPHPGRLSRLNIAALAVNGAFILLHILQTQLWYDGLAQDVPVWSSQFSVIIMLVIILYQLAPRRGLFAGRKIAWKREALALSNRWHGLYISWALVYTFWFHPTVGEFGLLIGFFYMFLLLVQLSFANTEVHFSLAWIAVLELVVGLHGPLIAIQKAIMGQDAGVPGFQFTGPGGFWIMFATGFLFMFAFTGQYSFRMPKWGRALVYSGYAALVAVLYALRGFSHLYEVTFIPFALYGGSLALALLARLGAEIGKKKGGKTRHAAPEL